MHSYDVIGRVEQNAIINIGKILFNWVKILAPKADSKFIINMQEKSFYFYKESDNGRWMFRW